MEVLLTFTVAYVKQYPCSEYFTVYLHLSISLFQLKTSMNFKVEVLTPLLDHQQPTDANY